MMRRIFITGTDTEVGKTYVSVKMLEMLAAQGRKTIALKPIASDAKWIDDRLVNTDACALQAAASISLPYDSVNPFVFEPAIAPHIAAIHKGVEMCVETIARHIRQITSNSDADVMLIEGAGGLLVPINSRQTWLDLVISLELEVIVVVGMRLGCINHALLTFEVFRSRGIQPIGWVANCLTPEVDYLQENIEAIERHSSLPRLATVDFNATTVDFCRW
ncbi:MAG: dethiobiotin synthase [Francisellaceae bacterium]